MKEIITTIYFLAAFAMAIYYAIRYRDDIQESYSEYIASVCFIAIIGPILYIPMAVFYFITRGDT